MTAAFSNGIQAPNRVNCSCNRGVRQPASNCNSSSRVKTPGLAHRTDPVLALERQALPPVRLQLAGMSAPGLQRRATLGAHRRGLPSSRVPVRPTRRSGPGHRLSWVVLYAQRSFPLRMPAGPTPEATRGRAHHRKGAYRKAPHNLQLDTFGNKALARKKSLISGHF